MDSKKSGASRSSTNNKNSRSRGSSNSSRLYHLIVSSSSTAADAAQSSNNKQQQVSSIDKQVLLLRKAITPETAAYQHVDTQQTPLHVAVRQLLDNHKNNESVVVIQEVLPEILQAYPAAVGVADAHGNIPLHYAIAPEITTSSDCDTTTQSAAAEWWKSRTAVTKWLIAADKSIAQQYLQRNNVVFQGSGSSDCSVSSPLYYAVQTIPDDTTAPPAQPPTLEFLRALVKHCHGSGSQNNTAGGNNNSDEYDKPLALLYRRFTRQFDLAEKFFAGDNSRASVVRHRTKYKTAAGNTWKIIELLLLSSSYNKLAAFPTRTVHRAVSGETPPDLLRYIVETNAEDLTVADPEQSGNLPLHYAAMNVLSSSSSQCGGCFPAFYSKYVIDELLYKYPEAAAQQNADGHYPLTLAVQAGKQWIGGGIKSLYDAYPEALQQIDLEQHDALKHALSMENDNSIEQDDDDEFRKEEKTSENHEDIIRDEQHDAIMLVQQPRVHISEVVTSMWAHEEDAGVQMLGCVAITKLLSSNGGEDDNHTMRIALSAVPAVVNAMKAHPNEVIVQEKACHALWFMASADGKREISFVASGAVAAIIGAMQAHVSDANVQEEACAATARIIRYGGADRATIVASVSGLTAIVNALAAHPDAVQVQRHGICALRELTEYPRANLPELPRSQTEALLQTAKQKFPHECGESVNVLLSRLS